MASYISYDVDIDDAGCSKCEHICESEEWCNEHCGPEHGWCEYEMSVISKYY